MSKWTLLLVPFIAFGVLYALRWTREVESQSPESPPIHAYRLEEQDVLARESSLATPDVPRRVAVSPSAADVSSRPSSTIQVGGVPFTVEWKGTLRKLRSPSGALRAEEYFLDGKLHGWSRSWHENGLLHAEGEYCDGKEVGAWIYHFPNGNRAAEGSFDSSKRTGPWRTWFDDGRLDSRVTYSDGLLDGACTYWNVITGVIDTSRTGLYRRGALIR